MKKPELPHESDIDFEMGNAIGLHDVRRLKALIKKGWPVPDSCVAQAFNSRHYDLLPVLFAAGGNPNVKLIHRIPSKPDTMLCRCILEEDIPTLRMLLKHGTDPNLPCGWSPPIVDAAMVGNLEIFRLLIGSGAALLGDPHIAARALFAAVERGHIAIVQYLVEQGISFRSRNYSGKSALEFAREKGMVEVLDLFRGYKRVKKSPTKASERTRTPAGD